MYHVTFDSRKSAEEALNKLEQLIDIYGVVTVADLHEIIEASYTYLDNKSGWTTLKSAEIVKVMGGYAIKLPKPIPINN